MTAPATAVSTNVHALSAKVERLAAATTKTEQRRMQAYWTPKRMLSAVSVGPEQDTPQGADAGGDEPPTGSAVQETAEARFGKVFFEIDDVGYACSGTATESANGDVVTTAGHCVTGGPGVFATNWAFVPAYENGMAPYGVWTAQALLTTSAVGRVPGLGLGRCVRRHERGPARPEPD